MKSSIVSYWILLEALQTNSCSMPRTTFNSCEMRSDSDMYLRFEKLKSPDLLKEEPKKKKNPQQKKNPNPKLCLICFGRANLQPLEASSYHLVSPSEKSPSSTINIGQLSVFFRISLTTKDFS